MPSAQNRRALGSHAGILADGRQQRPGAVIARRRKELLCRRFDLRGGFARLSRAKAGDASQEVIGPDIGHHQRREIHDLLECIVIVDVKSIGEFHQIAHIDAFRRDRAGRLARITALLSGLGIGIPRAPAIIDLQAAADNPAQVMQALLETPLSILGFSASSAPSPMSTPTRPFRSLCARTESGHAAVEPAIALMKSRPLHVPLNSDCGTPKA